MNILEVITTECSSVYINSYYVVEYLENFSKSVVSIIVYTLTDSHI